MSNLDAVNLTPMYYCTTNKSLILCATTGTDYFNEWWQHKWVLKII